MQQEQPATDGIRDRESTRLWRADVHPHHATRPRSDSAACDVICVASTNIDLQLYDQQLDDLFKFKVRTQHTHSNTPETEGRRTPDAGERLQLQGEADR